MIGGLQARQLKKLLIVIVQLDQHLCALRVEELERAPPKASFAL
jgi:hypothetical protein